MNLLHKKIKCTWPTVALLLSPILLHMSFATQNSVFKVRTKIRVCPKAFIHSPSVKKLPAKFKIKEWSKPPPNMYKVWLKVKD